MWQTTRRKKVSNYTKRNETLHTRAKSAGEATMQTPGGTKNVLWEA